MGKRKRARSVRRDIAARHEFDVSGLLGHGTTYSVNVNEQLALSIDTVFACVRILADLTADADIGEYKDNERLPDSRLTRAPMASISRRTWVWQLVAIMALYNGSYLWSRFGTDSDNVPISLEPLSPSRVLWTGPRTVHIDGVPVDPDELRWVPRMTMPTLTRDMSYTLRLARDAFAAAWAADAYRADYWQAGGAPLWYVKSDQVISDDDAGRIGDRLATVRSANPGRPPVVGKGAELKTLGVDLGAGGVSNAAAASGVSIARYFGMPAWLVNVPSEAGSLTYANASAAGLDLVRYTLQPGYAGPIGDAWSAELPGDYLTGRRVRLNLMHLTRGSVLEQAQAYQIAAGGARWLLPSEVRAELGLPMDMTLDESGTPAPAAESIPA